MRKSKHSVPYLVFGAEDKPNKTTAAYIDKTNIAHVDICQLKDDAEYEFGDASVELTDIEGTYVHLIFCRKESLRTMIKCLNALLEKWKEKGGQRQVGVHLSQAHG